MIQFDLRIFLSWNHGKETLPKRLEDVTQLPEKFVVDSACLPGLGEVLVYELNTEVWKNRQEMWLW